MFTSTTQLTTDQVRHLKWGVRGALGFGIAVSIGANAVHAVTESLAAHDPAGIMGGSIALAALAPIFAFVCLEMVVRIPVHSITAGAIRLGLTLALAGLAFWISYWNIAEVASRFHEHSTRYVWPGVIDGMMLVATISLVALSSYGQHVEQIIVADEAVAAEQAAIATAAQVLAAKTRAKALAEAQKNSPKWRKADAAGKRAWTQQWGQEYDAQQRRAAASVPTSPAPASQSPVAPVTEAELAAAVR
jgi:hypothetical protein